MTSNTCIASRFNTLLRSYSHQGLHTLPQTTSSEHIEPTRYALIDNTHYTTQNTHFLHLNINGLGGYQKQTKLNCVLATYPADIVALTETHLTHHNAHLYNIPGYTAFHKPRTRVNKRPAGGIACFIKAHFSPSVHTLPFEIQPTETICEILALSLTLNSQKALLLTLYRPPSGSTQQFLDSLNNILSYTQSQNCPTYLCGDLNMNLLNDCPSTEQLLLTCLSFNLKPTITIPTRLSPTTSTLIDNIWTPLTDTINDSVVILDDISDHYPITLSLEHNNTPTPQHPHYSKRDISENNINRLHEALAAELWDDVLDEHNAHDATTTLINKLDHYYDKHCPLLTYPQHVRPTKTRWLTRELQYQIKQKTNYTNYQETHLQTQNG